MSAARTPVEAPLHGPAGKPSAVSGFMASGLGIALFSSAVFGLSGSFAKALLETGWTRVRPSPPDLPGPP
ncbi:conserved hypothetical protein [Arthrobacter sp. Hiyo6]|nr:conserved hypothetical protein [Arthrobacter sp. Hiyo6]